MDNAHQVSFPYESLNKYTESIVQCPICHYYLKINPQTDSMKYRIISESQIQFLTLHKYISSVHTVIIEYLNYSFSKIIDFTDNGQQPELSDSFQLFHLVSVSEYQNFRDRILDLESNNNKLINSFKKKLDSLESTYKKTELDNKSHRKQILELDDLRIDYENCLSDKMVELDNLRKTFEITLNKEKEYLIQVKDSQVKILDLQSQNRSLYELHEKLKIQIYQKNKELSAKRKPDQKFLDLLNNERQQKRTALNEQKKILEQLDQLKEKYSYLEERSSTEKNLIEKELLSLKNRKDELEHKLTLKYEQKISELTLTLQDKEELLLLKEKNNTIKTIKFIKYDKAYREQLSKDFLSLQKKFNAIQYDIIISLYDIEKFDSQIRNAFERFFLQLVNKFNKIGQILLNDNDFSLFKDIRELELNTKLSEEQEKSIIELEAMKIVFSELSVYVFSIIKSIKAYAEENTFVLIPEDVQIHAIINSYIQDNKIIFTIPTNVHDNLSDLGSKLRVFRPISELYKNSFVFITKEEGQLLYNNNYQLIPYQIESAADELILEIENFFHPNDIFQIGSLYDGEYFIIQRMDFRKELNLIREFAQKNKISTLSEEK